ncbi:MAG: T9SS type A sorting domain-containing protein [Bacteroidetes bacterium]|nr:T9SS type A sorting domain-containing protein [Bacteroidota bacterium]MBU1678997.1 T9SS type A sorting domain-containing protein [Bacteroidota bacterium]MBU2506016.1 T9SS type A sorting domain-containing protein [Bacteroidota bacterium]
MINIYRKLFTFIFLLVSFSVLNAQVFDGVWNCLYATIDDQPNATGNRTISVATSGDNAFAALVADFADSCYYIVNYKDADSLNGRLGSYQYSGKGQVTMWLAGFDQVSLTRAKDMAHFKIGDHDLLFVASNDPEKNILVFKMTPDSIETYPMRMSTASNPFDIKNIWAIDMDNSGRVYVTTEGTESIPSEVWVYESPSKETAWSDGYMATPIQTITLPDNGDARGVAVNGDGTVVYVSNYLTKKVYCYTGDPATGYTLYNGFSFLISDEVTDGTTTIYPGPWGLTYMRDYNILFVSSATDYENNAIGYSYGKIFIVNPNNGEIMDTLDAAEWNFEKTGAYNNNGPGNVSGYASPYNCDVDDLNNLYAVSYYGWTIDKWQYLGTLPIITLTITSIEIEDGTIPNSFSLEQNYPNPFNPNTTIKFSLVERSNISLDIYSISGELVSSLIEAAEFEKGVYEVTFNASNLASGTYIYTITDGSRTLSKKLTLIK